MIVWLTTVRSDGQPQTSPVWFLWDGQDFLIYSQPQTQKLRNIARNPAVSLNLDSDGTGGEVVTIEGSAEMVSDAPSAEAIPEYVDKYRDHIAALGFTPEGFARSYSQAIRVTPRRARVY